MCTRSIFLGRGYQRKEELDLVVHEFTVSSVCLPKEIKHHIKTQYILGGKIKTQKGPILCNTQLCELAFS